MYLYLRYSVHLYLPHPITIKQKNRRVSKSIQSEDKIILLRATEAGKHHIGECTNYIYKL